MAKNLYLTATEARSGKSLVSLGMMEILLRKTDRVGFFRPIVAEGADGRKPDHDIHLISSYFKLDAPYQDMYGYRASEASDLFSRGRAEEIIEGIIKKYTQMEKRYDFVLCEGTDFTSSTAAFELDINAEISKNLGCPVLLVSNAHQKDMDETLRSIELALESLEEKGCTTVATIVNRTKGKEGERTVSLLQERDLTRKQLVYAIPNENYLENPTVDEIVQALGAKVLYGKDQLHRHVHGFMVAAMQLRNFLARIEHGSLIIVPGDRADVIVACLAAMSSTAMETISGLLLTGGLIPEGPIKALIEGFPHTIPVLSVQENTFPTATLVHKVHATISPEDDRKITRALALFDKNVNVEELTETIITSRTSVVTPKMFEYNLLEMAKKRKQHIVFPEGADDRILQAAELLLHREVVNITLLGSDDHVRERAATLGLQLKGANILDPQQSERFHEYVEAFYELRKHKGITEENARDMLGDFNYYATMMIAMGGADGMVSGAVHTTRDTIRPALEIIKAKPGFSVISSVFFMCLKDRVLVYGDCAVNPDPNARDLAEIAISSAGTAKVFGIEPVVAMLSYSTGESGQGTDVDKVREATRIAREMALERDFDLKIDGPIQYDAAIDPLVAETKMPGSAVAGRATVFIFPDLNTGNNTYKAVQRSSGAVAVGPVMQGLKHPVNDLSRGCTIPDIVNTAAITAIQAQAEKGTT
jgi:phosphate acetyltransferase